MTYISLRLSNPNNPNSKKCLYIANTYPQKDAIIFKSEKISDTLSFVTGLNKFLLFRSLECPAIDFDIEQDGGPSMDLKLK